MIAIVDYEAGNVGSVANALKRIGAGFEVTSDAGKIKSAAGVIFPGQGRAGPAMKSLRKSGLHDLLPALTQPFLGMCLGMQLMMQELEEDSQTGLGLVPGRCVRLRKISPVPHMGWNHVDLARETPLFNGLNSGFYQYFVHSYVVDAPAEFTLATTEYGGKFASAITKNNFYGVQFHPEKSADGGELILKNFLKMCGENRW